MFCLILVFTEMEEMTGADAHVEVIIGVIIGVLIVTILIFMVIVYRRFSSNKFPTLLLSIAATLLPFKRGERQASIASMSQLCAIESMRPQLSFSGTSSTTISSVILQPTSTASQATLPSISTSTPTASSSSKIPTNSHNMYNRVTSQGPVGTCTSVEAAGKCICDRHCNSFPQTDESHILPPAFVSKFTESAGEILKRIKFVESNSDMKNIIEIMLELFFAALGFSC